MELDIIKIIGELGLAGVLAVIIILWQKDWKRHEEQLMNIIKESNEVRKTEYEIRMKHTEALTKLATVIERCNRNGN